MMQSKVVLHIRNPFLLDASTYVSTGVMALLGISGLHSLRQQIVALILCLIFVLLYRFLFRTGAYERNPIIYFGLQTVVLTLLLLLRSDASDAFNFLFYILTVHATVVFTTRTATAWVAFYFIIATSAELFRRGADGLYAAFFYLAAFVVCAIFGHTVQQTELTSERNQRLVEELKETQQKLQELAVVEERNRLARDLHDSVKQQVFAISMQLSAARTALSESDKAYQSVVEAERLAQQAGAELTTLIHELRPPGLEKKTLADAVREYVEEWSRQNRIVAQTNIDSTIVVDEKVEQALFRVLQEALANVARHSKADKIIVELKMDEHAMTLVIADNGIGFDSKQTAKGIGLDSMQERLIAVNGKVEVISEKSKGTRVVAKVRRS
jgi:signal transduction histidine kinase